MITNLIAIDPGYSTRGDGNACALLIGGELWAVWFARSGDPWSSVDTLLLHPPEFPGDSWAPISEQVGDADLVILELPQTRRRGTGAQATAETLIQLTAEGCLLAGIYAGVSGGRVELVTPSDWKGSVPKPIQHKQVWARLSDAERALLGGDATYRQIIAAVDRGASARWPAGKQWYPRGWAGHNTLDAVALGKTRAKGSRS